MTKVNLQSYKEMLEQPWGKIQYELTFAQLAHLQGKDILDFGSGMGMVSEFLSRTNRVVAVEPNEDMLRPMEAAHFTKILGSLEVLEKMPERTFDVILCHNVLEYIAPEERADYLAQFERLMKDDGQISIMKHNLPGKVLQSVVLSNKVEEALGLLRGESFKSPSFTQGRLYSIEDLLQMGHFELVEYFGIRTFYSLQPNEFKTSDNWLQEMIQIELAVSDLKPYKDISFLQHVWLRKGTSESLHL